MDDSQSTVGRKFGDVTFGERVHLLATLLRLPAVLTWNIVTKPFVSHNAEKPWRRVLTDTVLRTAIHSLNRPQLQYAFGDSSGRIIEEWASRTKVPIDVEYIGENAKLIWIGQKQTENVVLYLHGGGYQLPIQEASVGFWRYAQREWKRRGQDVGIVILQYTLFPNANFPTPLRQTVKALHHLLSSGVQPQNLQVTGDSAGGNLVIQLLLHILHPLDGIPSVKLSAPIGGAYLMSPWTRIVGQVGHPNDGIDTVNSAAATGWGLNILRDIPESHKAYLEVADASPMWFDGVDKVVSRVLTTAGGSEVLKDGIVQFHDVFEKHHKDARLVIQRGGVHDDPFNDFFLREESPAVGELTPVIVDWFLAGFTQ